MNNQETKTAFIALIGRPNAGKSTLLNKLLGEKIAAVSRKPQTTRTAITGILTRENVQYVFLDTPGVHRPRTKLGDYMMKAVGTATADVSLLLMVVEPVPEIGAPEEEIFRRFEKSGVPVILLINKIDLIKPEEILKVIDVYAKRFPFAAVIPVSGKTGEGVDDIFREAEPFLQTGDWFFPSDMITDQPERTIAAEIIREKILRLTDQEIPHGVAVMIEGFRETKDLIDIRAEIYCEKPGHKKILIGKDGQMLKKIGSFAREDLEAFFGVHVNINLWVKVKENWRDNELILNSFGFSKKDL